jgi:hypothetical protein
MFRALAGVAVIALLATFVPVAAHENHALIVIAGTVAAVETGRLQLDTFDRTTLQRKKLWLLIDAKTRLRIGKERVETLDLRPGHQVDTVAQSEDTPDGSLRYRAIQIRLNQPKAR